MTESPTIKSMKVLQATVDNLKAEGIDPVFIYAALTQVQSNLHHEHGDSFTK